MSLSLLFLAVAEGSDNELLKHTDSPHLIALFRALEDEQTSSSPPTSAATPSPIPTIHVSTIPPTIIPTPSTTSFSSRLPTQHATKAPDGNSTLDDSDHDASVPTSRFRWAAAVPLLSLTILALTWRKRAGDLLCCHGNIVPDEIVIRRHDDDDDVDSRNNDIELMPVSTLEMSSAFDSASVYIEMDDSMSSM